MLCGLLPAGETEGFSDGKYSLHLYMYKGPGATVCWATRDHFEYEQTVRINNEMTCYSKDARGNVSKNSHQIIKTRSV